MATENQNWGERSAQDLSLQTLRILDETLGDAAHSERDAEQNCDSEQNGDSKQNGDSEQDWGRDSGHHASNVVHSGHHASNVVHSGHHASNVAHSDSQDDWQTVGKPTWQFWNFPHRTGVVAVQWNKNDNPVAYCVADALGVTPRIPCRRRWMRDLGALLRSRGITDCTVLGERAYRILNRGLAEFVLKVDHVERLKFRCKVCHSDACVQRMAFCAIKRIFRDGRFDWPHS